MVIRPYPRAHLPTQISRLPPQISPEGQHDGQSNREEYKGNGERARQHHAGANDHERLQGKFFGAGNRTASVADSCVGFVKMHRALLGVAGRSVILRSRLGDASE
jgi:hypothetical protein